MSYSKKKGLHKDLGLKCRRHQNILKKTSENDREIPQSRTADQPVVIPLWLVFRVMLRGGQEACASISL